MKTIKKTVTLKLHHFEINGIAYATMWGGGDGTIDMKPFTVASVETDDLIAAGLNDNGFGVSSINSALVDIFAVYTDDQGASCRKYVDTKTVESPKK